MKSPRADGPPGFVFESEIFVMANLVNVTLAH
jgi:hypothetical protein